MDRVEFYIGTTLIGTDSDGSDGYKAAWNTASTGDGAKSITVKGYDTSSNMGRASRSVTVDNATPVMGAVAQSPAMHLSVKSAAVPPTVPIKLRYSATDNLTPDAEIQFQVQRRTNTGGVWGAWTTVQPWTKRGTSYPYLAPGTHRLRVQAKDLAGNVTSYKQGAVFTVAEHQESASSVTYSSTPGWSVSASSGSYDGNVKQSSRTGAVTTFVRAG